MKRPVYRRPVRPIPPPRSLLASAKHRARGVLLFAGAGLVVGLVVTPGKAAPVALALLVAAVVFLGPLALVAYGRRLGDFVRRLTRPVDDGKPEADDDEPRSSSWLQP